MKSIIAVLLLPAVTNLHAQTVLRVGTGTSIKSSGGASINLKDVNLENNGTINQAKGDGSFRFSGKKNATISGSSSPTFAILKIAKTNAKVSLATNINIVSSVAFTSGLLDLNKKNMTLNASASLSGESETSYIIGPLGGEVVITVNMNKPTAVNAGNLGAVITSAFDLGQVTIRRGHKLQSGTGMQGSIARYYSIVPTSAQTSTVRLYYLDTELNGKIENQLKFFRSADNGGSWFDQSFTSRNVASNWVEKTGVTAFDRLTLSSDVAFTGISTDPSSELAQQDKMMLKKFVVGPNPNNGNFWFVINSIDKETTVSLFTTDGKRVKEFRVSDQRQQQVNGIANGVYLLTAPGLETFKVVVAGSTE